MLVLRQVPQETRHVERTRLGRDRALMSEKDAKLPRVYCPDCGQAFLLRLHLRWFHERYIDGTPEPCIPQDGATFEPAP